MSDSPAPTCALDRAVQAAAADLGRRGMRAPAALLFPATGAGLLATRLRGARRVALAEIAGVPETWRSQALVAGQLGDLAVWLIEDAAGAADEGGLERAGEPEWTRGFPVWLAAEAGASACVHASAGVALARAGTSAPRPGSVVLARDHVNLSGRTPLFGLADSTLGPLFPDCSALHDAGLRMVALARARELALACQEGVAACVAGPALETPAERAFWAGAGADVAVQGLQNPLLAAAHCGLAALAIVCVTDAGDAAGDVRGFLQRAEELAPALEELVVGLAPALSEIAAEAGAAG